MPKRQIELSPNSAEALTCFGIMLLVDDDVDESIETLSKALQFDPSDIVAYKNLEIAYRRKGDSKSALMQTKKMFAASPTTKTALHLISAYHTAYARLAGVFLVLLIVLAIILQTTYLLIPHLLYAIYGFWIGARVLVAGKWKPGLFSVAYSVVMVAIAYVIYVFIR